MIRMSSPIIGRSEADAARRVVLSGQLAQGPEVAALEAELASKLGVTDVVAVSNGTVALELAVRGLGLEPGAEIVTSPFTFFATASAILKAGAVPVLADIDPATYNLDPDAVADAITPRTAALMPVHLYGRPCDMKAFEKLARRHSLAIVEDACQAIGAQFGSRCAGSFGLGCFSFYGSKNIMSGEGGAIACRSKRVADRIRILRNQGSAKTYTHVEIAGNYRMTDIQAAILRAQLDRLDKITSKRQSNAKRYAKLIDNPGVALPPPDDETFRSSHHQYTIRVPARQRSRFQKRLSERGVESRIYYPVPVHKQPVWNQRDVAMPNTENASSEVVSIPVHPNLTAADLEAVAAAVNSYRR